MEFDLLCSAWEKYFYSHSHRGAHPFEKIGSKVERIAILTSLSKIFRALNWYRLLHSGTQKCPQFTYSFLFSHALRFWRGSKLVIRVVLLHIERIALYVTSKNLVTLSSMDGSAM